jgi:hypothetical protein
MDIEDEITQINSQLDLIKQALTQLRDMAYTSKRHSAGNSRLDSIMAELAQG